MKIIKNFAIYEMILFDHNDLMTEKDVILWLKA